MHTGHFNRLDLENFFANSCFGSFSVRTGHFNHFNRLDLENFWANSRFGSFSVRTGQNLTVCTYKFFTKIVAFRKVSCCVLEDFYTNLYLSHFFNNPKGK